MFKKMRILILPGIYFLIFLLISSTAFVPTTLAASTAQSGSHTIWVQATGYCPCDKCNYPFGGMPSYLGYPLTHGIIAVDPDVIPMGSKLFIPGYGEGIAADRGNAIIGNHIDLCFATHSEALAWGIRTIAITVYDE